MSLDTQHKSLVEVAQELNAKANLLDSAQLDHIEGRLTALAQKMDSINEKTAAMPEDIERNHKVHSRSFDVIRCWGIRDYKIQAETKQCEEGHMLPLHAI